MFCHVSTDRLCIHGNLRSADIPSDSIPAERDHILCSEMGEQRILKVYDANKK